MKQFLLSITFLLSLIPISLSAQKDDSKYLAGAVPMQDGKVVFSQEFAVPGATQDQIFAAMMAWLTEEMAENKNESRVLYEDKGKGQIAAMGEEDLIFTQKVLMLDRATMNYQVNIFCKPGACAIEIEKIRYEYQENEKYLAEEWIADDIALNKSKTKMARGSMGKFRRKTVDFVQTFFNGASEALGVSQPGPAKVKSKSLITVTPVTTDAPELISASPVVVPAAPSITISEISVSTTSSDLSGYRSISPDKIPGNIIKMLSDDWMLITAGTDKNFNMMTASWGGLGRLYEKPVAVCFMNPARHTFKLMETNDTYTFTFYTEAYRDILNYCGTTSGKDTDKVKGSGLTPITTPNGSKAFSEAWLIIECKKMVSQSLIPEALNDKAAKDEWTGKPMHKMFIGEIINVWVK